MQTVVLATTLALDIGLFYGTFNESAITPGVGHG